MKLSLRIGADFSEDAFSGKVAETVGSVQMIPVRQEHQVVRYGASSKAQEVAFA
jgi:hypothetical protein